MNLIQFHERLRLELLRRVQRGTLSVSLLARQTGFGQPHLSNFLRGRRQLSLRAMDRILEAQRLSAADLLAGTAHGKAAAATEESGVAPLVSHAAALFEPQIRPASIQAMLSFPAGVLASMRPRAVSNARRAWQRFVAVRAHPADAQAMGPMVQPEAIALIDRHYNSLAPYRPDRSNLYAVRQGAHLQLRYAHLDLNRLVLRPYNIAFAVELIDMDENAPGDALAGRVVLLMNEL
ncbi:MAG TPA: hypothetical protein VGG26_01145 [Terracidiphilus sp.]|jgi:hypothetical protein